MYLIVVSKIRSEGTSDEYEGATVVVKVTVDGVL